MSIKSGLIGCCILLIGQFTLAQSITLTPWVKGTFLGAPTDIAVVDSYVVVLDAFFPALHILDSETGTLMTSWGQQGQGPGEFISPVALLPDTRYPQRFWIYDIATQQLTAVSIPRIIHTPTYQGEQRIRLQGEGVPLSLTSGGDSLWIATGIFPSGRLALYDKHTGKQLRIVGPPPTCDKTVPAAVCQHAHRAWVTAHPTLPRVATFAFYADQVTIYTINGQIYARGHGPDRFTPVFDVAYPANRPPALAPRGDTRIGYLQALTADPTLLGLYSGKRHQEGNATLGSEIHRYNWQAQRIGRYTLNHGIHRFVMQGAYIYAITTVPEPALLRGMLPTSLPVAH